MPVKQHKFGAQHKPKKSYVFYYFLIFLVLVYVVVVHFILGGDNADKYEPNILNEELALDQQQPHVVEVDAGPKPVLETASCTEAQANQQETKFIENGFKQRNVWYWGCPKDVWWQLVHKWSPSPDKKAFVDVGMNKGYVAGTWFGLWNPEVGVTVKSIHDAIRKTPPNDKQDCGACGDCLDNVTPLVQKPLGSTDVIKVYGYDAAEVAVKKQQAMVDKFFLDAKEHWIGTHAAVAKEVGMAKFPKLDILSEIASLDGSHDQDNPGKMVDVKVVNAPSIFKQWDLDHAFVFKIDTEGHDPDVLKGAHQLLVEQKITILYFEYHDLGLWKTQESLKEHTEVLDKAGYECFLLGHSCAFALSNTCWNELFEFRQWSNVMCISRFHGADLIEVIRDHSFGYSKNCKK